MWWNSNWNNETINRSNGEDILCMLNVECWETLHSTLSGAVYELLIFTNDDDDDDDTHPLMLINKSIKWLLFICDLQNGFSNFFLVFIVNCRLWFTVYDCHCNNVSKSILIFNFRNKKTLFTLECRSKYYYYISLPIKCLPKQSLVNIINTPDIQQLSTMNRRERVRPPPWEI